MKNAIERLQRYKALHKILKNSPQAIEDKPLVKASVDAMALNNEQLTALISDLSRPGLAIVAPRVQYRRDFKELMYKATDLGVLVASKAEDATLLMLVKTYRNRIQGARFYSIYEMAVHLSAELNRYPELLTAFEAAELMTTLQAKIDNFDLIADEITLSFNERKVKRDQLAVLLKSNTRLLRNDLDRFVALQEVAFPDLYASFRRLRRPRPAQHTNGSADLGDSDISGTVTDALTGLPIAGASVTLVQHGSVFNADEDGYYLFDELPTGDYTIGCFAPGYQVPEQAEVNIETDETSLVIDFSLTQAKGVEG
jgi:hypothetical protein